MSEETILAASKRVRLGTAECRRLRREGFVPGNLYGHGEGAVSFKIKHDAVFKAVHEGHISIDLDLEGAVEKAVFKEVQWDTFGRHIVHVDLIRVDPNEKVEVEVPVVTKGEAPGVAHGGLLDLHLHTLQVKCPVFKIPAFIEVRLNELEVGDAIRVQDLKLDVDIEPLQTGDAIVVQVNEPKGASGTDEDGEDSPELVAETSGGESDTKAGE